MANGIISEKTLVPLSIFGLVAGGIFSLSFMYIQGQANAEGLAELKLDMTKKIDEVQQQRRDGRAEMNHRFDVLEQKMDRLLRRSE